MLNSKTIEASLAARASHPDEDVRSRLSLFGPALLAAARLAETARTTTVAPDDAALSALLFDENKTVLAAGALSIDPESFRASVLEVAAALREALKPEGEFDALMENYDWTPLTSSELVGIASREPLAYLERVTEIAAEDPLLDLFVLPALGYALRAHLDRFATETSRRIERLDDPVTAHDRRRTCPVCGTPATFAGVVATKNTGHVKKLFCECCGASWKFERIRCIVCGSEAVSDLKYVHDAEDDAHRLHVCDSCGAAAPTYFAKGDEESFSPDVEAIVLTGLELAYAEENAAPAAPEA